MDDLFFILAIACSGIALIFGFRGLLGKGSERLNWKFWFIFITFYLIFMGIGLILRG